MFNTSLDVREKRKTFLFWWAMLVLSIFFTIFFFKWLMPENFYIKIYESTNDMMNFNAGDLIIVNGKKLCISKIKHSPYEYLTFLDFQLKENCD